MNKKLVVLGGGTGQSILLSGLKKFPFDITSVVSVCDDGKSTGRLRKEFNVPAMGDLRRVLIALAETEDVVEKFVNYRFSGNNELCGHTVGNILLTALADIYGNMSNAVSQFSKILNMRGKVIPFTDDDNIMLMSEMEDGSTVEGEHNITQSNKKIKRVYYKNKVKVNPEVINSIKESDAIILSMGSVYTSIIPNLLCKEVIDAIDNSHAKIIYICNIMTQPGETDDFKVSDHINLLDSYLGKRKIDVVMTNSEKISKKIQRKYETMEQKDLVKVDDKNIKIEHVKRPFAKIEDSIIRHDSIKVGLEIMNILIK